MTLISVEDYPRWAIHWRAKQRYFGGILFCPSTARRRKSFMKRRGFSAGTEQATFRTWGSAAGPNRAPCYPVWTQVRIWDARWLIMGAGLLDRDSSIDLSLGKGRGKFVNNWRCRLSCRGVSRAKFENDLGRHDRDQRCRNGHGPLSDNRLVRFCSEPQAGQGRSVDWRIREWSLTS